MEETKAGGQTKKEDTLKGLTEKERLRKKKIQASNELAYTLEEVAEMLDKLPEPSRTVCTVAAFTGLTRSELRGLKWEDYDGETINVRRKIWNDHVGAPKTEAREAGVYVVPLLRKILMKYKTSYPPIGDEWIFSRRENVATARPRQLVPARHSAIHQRSMVRVARIPPWSRHKVERGGGR
jgi:integrase